MLLLALFVNFDCKCAGNSSKNGKSFLWMCLRILLGNHQRVCITKLLKSLHPIVQPPPLQAGLIFPSRWNIQPESGHCESSVYNVLDKSYIHVDRTSSQPQVKLSLLRSISVEREKITHRKRKAGIITVWCPQVELKGKQMPSPTKWLFFHPTSRDANTICHQALSAISPPWTK